MLSKLQSGWTLFVSPQLLCQKFSWGWRSLNCEAESLQRGWSRFDLLHWSGNRIWKAAGSWVVRVLDSAHGFNALTHWSGYASCPLSIPVLGRPCHKKRITRLGAFSSEAARAKLWMVETSCLLTQKLTISPNRKLLALEASRTRWFPAKSKATHLPQMFNVSTECAANCPRVSCGWKIGLWVSE